MNPNEEQLKSLRQKVLDIRAAKALCQNYQLVCNAQLRGSMTQFYRWLDGQEKEAIRLGKQLKGQN